VWEGPEGVPRRALIVKKPGVAEASRRLEEIAGWLQARGVQVGGGPEPWRQRQSFYRRGLPLGTRGSAFALQRGPPSHRLLCRAQR
jgi:hypothetical protein